MEDSNNNSINQFERLAMEAIFHEKKQAGKNFDYALACAIAENKKRNSGDGWISLEMLSVEQVRDIGWLIYHSPVEFADSEHTQLLPYPIEVWKDTIYSEFAERCTADNNIPKEMFLEAIKTMVGAVVANRVKGNKLGMNLRQYTVFVMEPGSGKDTTINAADNLLRCNFDDYDYTFDTADRGAFLVTNKKTDYTNIGATVVSAASENGLIDAAKHSPRVLWLPAELGTLLSKGMEKYGVPLMDVLRRCYDYSNPQFTTAEQRKNVPDLLYLSLLTTIQPDKLENMQQGSGLPSRITWLTPPPFKKVASLGIPVLGDLPVRLFAKLHTLEKLPHDIIKVTPEADKLLEEWFDAALMARKVAADAGALGEERRQELLLSKAEAELVAAKARLENYRNENTAAVEALKAFEKEIGAATSD